MRLIAALFYQKTVLKDMSNNMKMMTFLKRMKQSKKHRKGRIINIFISSMQILVTYATYLSLIINITQEVKLKMIIKTYVALCFLCTIDDQFVKVLPESVIENANTMNSSGILVIREDFNTTKLILSNLCTEGNRDKLSVMFESFI